jgi:(p)ppGpp synthase/HD superfamily hydrolase
MNKDLTAKPVLTVDEVFKWASEAHDKAGCTYGENNLSYALHLAMVLYYCRYYAYLLPQEIWDDVAKACICHDILEDTNNSYNDLAKVIGVSAADMVYNVTDELGKNRKERKERTLPKIKACRYSTYVKLMDRLANVEYSNGAKSRMFSMYQDEHTAFCLALYTEEYSEIWGELGAMLLGEEV